MIPNKKAVLSWSGGKDSALALRKVLQEKTFDIISLFTTITKETQTSSVHSISLEILKEQANSIGIPLVAISVSEDLRDYQDQMKTLVNHFLSLGVKFFIFGDLSLSNNKVYRENLLNPLGIQVVEPLWGKSSEEVIEDFLKSGLKAKIIVVQADKLDASFIGKEINENLIKSLPPQIDSCGENGEYHTLIYDGDIFKNAIDFKLGPINLISNEIQLENGENRIFKYYQAEIL